VTDARHLPLVTDDDAIDFVRPKRREDCAAAIRPCPWGGCEFNLAVDISRRNGTMQIVGDPELMSETCVLDVVDRGGATLEEVGAIYGVTRERMRQVEAGAAAKLKERVSRDLLDGWTNTETVTIQDEGFEFFGPAFAAAVDRAYRRIVPANERGSQLLRIMKGGAS
jgi:hypothetical protein